MRKLPALFLLSLLAAALGAYLSNAYQQHQREKIEREQAAFEQQQRQYIERTPRPAAHEAHDAHDSHDAAHELLSRDNRERPQR